MRSKATFASVLPIRPTRMALELVDGLDFRRRLFFRSPAGKTGSRPQHEHVLTHDDDRFGVTGHVQIAARDREIGLGGCRERRGFASLPQ
jgi:hypothetical protein